MRLFHRHRWEPIDVQHHQYVIGGGELTVLLKRCEKCDDHTIEKVDGLWPKEYFLGPKKERKEA